MSQLLTSAQDLIDQSGAGNPALVDPTPTAFSAGLRQGALSMGSQLQSFAGGAGRAMGYNDFAARRDASAKGLQDEAAEAGPRVQNWDDVHGLRDFWDYGTGQAGAMAPALGVGIGAGALTALTGGGALAGIGAATAAMSPQEIGAVLQRQGAEGQPQNFGRAVGTGILSSAAQNVVPAVVGGALLGQGVKATAKAVEKEALKKGALRAAAGDLHGPAPELVGPPRPDLVGPEMPVGPQPPLHGPAPDLVGPRLPSPDELGAPPQLAGPAPELVGPPAPGGVAAPGPLKFPEGFDPAALPNLRGETGAPTSPMPEPPVVPARPGELQGPPPPLVGPPRPTPEQLAAGAPQPQGLMSRLAEGAVKDATGQGLGMGASELAQQYGANPDKPIDWSEVSHAAGGGMVVGAPLGALHAGAHAFHQGKADFVQGAKDLAGKGADLAGKGYQKTKEKLAGGAASAYSGAGAAVDAAPGMVGKAAEVAGEVASKVKGKGAEYLDALKKAMDRPDATDEEIVSGSPLAGATEEERAVLANKNADPEAQQGVLDQIAERIKQRTQQAATKLADTLDLDPETRKKAAEIAQGAGDAASAAWVATKTRALKVKEGFKEGIDNLGKAGAAIKEHYQGNKAGVSDFMDDINRAAAAGIDPTDLVNKTASEKQPGWGAKLAEAARLATGTDPETLAQRKAMGLDDPTALRMARVAKKWMSKLGPEKTEEGVKKSEAEDYNPEVRAKIGEAIAGKVPPEIANDPALMSQLGKHLKNFAHDMAGFTEAGHMEDQIDLFRPFFGKDTFSVLSGIIDAVHGTGDPAKTAAFFRNAANYKAHATATDNLETTVRNALPPEMERHVPKLVKTMVDWAEGRGEGIGADQERNAAKHQEFKDQLKKIFGNRTDSVLDAVQKHVEDEATRRFEMSHNEGHVVDDEQTTSVDEGGNMDAHPNEAKPEAKQQLFANNYKKLDDGTQIPKPMMNPELQNLRAPPGEIGTTQKLLNQKKKEFPNSHVEWVSQHDEHGSGSQTHGYIKVHDAPAEGEMKVSHIRNSMLDESKAKNSPSRMEIEIPEDQRANYGVNNPKLVLDAVRLAKQGRDARQEATGSDQASDKVRLARGFFNAYASLVDTFGKKPVLPEKLKTVIGYDGGKAFTLEDATKLDMTTAADRASDKDLHQAVSLREDLARGRIPVKQFRELMAEKSALMKKENEGTNTAADNKRHAQIDSMVKDSQLSRQEAKPLEKELFELEVKRKASLQSDEESPLQQTQRRLQDAMSQLGALVNSGRLSATGDAEVRLNEIEKRMGELGGKHEYSEAGRREMNALQAERRKMLNLGINDLPDTKELPLKSRALKLDEQITKLRERRDELEHQDRLKGALEIGEGVWQPGDKKGTGTNIGSEGRTEIGKDEQIHRVVAEHGNKADETPLNVREDENAPMKTGAELMAAPGDARGKIAEKPPTAQPMKRDGKPFMNAAQQLLNTEKPVAVGLGQKLMALARNVDALDTADYNRLRDVMNPKERTAGSIGQTVNDLADKYGPILSKRAKAAGEMKAGSSGAKTPGGEGVRPKPKSSDYTGQARLALEGETDTQAGATSTRGSAFEQGRGTVHIGNKDTGLPQNIGTKEGVDVDRYGNPVKEGPKGPKAVAAKKAALDKAASSSDPALLKELSTTGNMDGLGRTAGYLAEHHPDSEAARVAGESYDRATVHDDNAYEGVKKSVQGQRIHDELEREGFAATHDSPSTFSGEFDWRTHAFSGEGAMVYGAGTYLSTAEGVHKNYKDQFTAKVRERDARREDILQMPHVKRAYQESDQAWQDFNEASSHHGYLSEQAEAAAHARDIKNWDVDQFGNAQLWDTDEWGTEGLAHELLHVKPLEPHYDTNGNELPPGWYKVDNFAPESHEYLGDTFTDAREKLADKQGGPSAEEMKKLDDHVNSLMKTANEADKHLEDLINKELAKSGTGKSGLQKNTGKAPTYEVSVNIPQEHILDWSVPISEQSQHVKDVLASLDTPPQDKGEIKWNQKPQNAIPSLGLPAKEGTFEHNGEHYYTKKNTAGRTYIYQVGESKPVGSVSGSTHAELVSGIETRMRYGEPSRLGQVIARDGSGSDFYKTLSSMLGGDRQASDALQAAGIPAMKHNSSGGSNAKFPNYVILDDSKIGTNYVHFSQQQAAAGHGPSPAGQTAADALAHLYKVLGNSVQVDMTKYLGHAGDWNPAKDLVRISAHMLNKKNVAYHESLHAFFTQLYRSGNPKIAQVLLKAGQSEHVQAQMREYFKNEPKVLEAMKADPEEAAAYMYQLWEQGDLKMNPQATTVFGKIAEFVRSVLGVWSNDKRALEIMQHFSSGEYAKNIGKPNAVALLGKGTNPAFEMAKKMFSPATDLGERVFASGNSRLRDTDIPALGKIADLVKTKLIDRKDDTGFLSAAREERAQRMNQLSNDLGPMSQATQADALGELQGGVPASTGEGKAAVAVIRQYQADMHQYITDGGQQIGFIKDHFPRVWDSDTILSNQKAFLGMIEKYVQAGMYKSDPMELLRTLTANDGNNFAVDTRLPGFQSGKERSLDFISKADAEPFLNKNLYETMNNYTTQATRRVEFGRRFGADGKGLDRLMRQAEREGATPEQLATAEKYLKGVTGTLGDGINPQARRLMGNMTVYQNIRLLPLAIFSSVVDPLGIAVRGGTVGDAWKAAVRGFKEMPQSFKKSGSKDWQTELSETLGVIDNATLMHAVGSMYTQGMVGGFARKMNETFFKYNLMEQYNRSMRVAATESSLKFMERHAIGANKHSERYLAELGLKKGDVQIDPSTGRVKTTVDEGLTQEHADRMRTAVHQWVDGAVLRPDNADRPIWFNDPHFMLLSHLKSFTYSFHHTIIDRVMHEAKNGNYQPMAVLASYVPTMIAADFMKGMIQGGGQQPQWKKDWGPEDYIWSGVQRGGLLGVGQFGADVAGDVVRGKSGIGALAGPTFDQLGEAADVAGGRERFGKFALDSMPANALYAGFIKGHSVARDPTFAE